MKKCKQILMAAGLVVVAGSAQAVVIDFQVAAVTQGESAWNTLNTTTLGYVMPSIDITASPAGAYAYLDAVSGGNPAGLGVCSTGLEAGETTGAQAFASRVNVCFDSADDNVDLTAEALHFTFKETSSLQGIWLNNNHDGGNLTGNSVLFSQNGGAAVTYTFAAEDLLAPFGYGYYVDLSTVFTSTTYAIDEYFTVAYDTANGVAGTKPLGQFYVSAIDVPAPAPLALLGLGLIGLFATSRKKA